MALGSGPPLILTGKRLSNDLILILIYDITYSVGFQHLNGDSVIFKDRCQGPDLGEVPVGAIFKP